MSMYKAKITSLILIAGILTISLISVSHAQPTQAQQTTNNPKKLNIFNTHNVFSNLTYARQSRSQKLDIYLPERLVSAVPVIIAVHGGGFAKGDKTDLELRPILMGLERGYAVISINYRSSQESKFPTQIHDVKAAIRWIRAYAQTFSLDPERISIWGVGSGGYLASIVGTSGGVPELEDLSLGWEEYSSEVQAVVNWYGQINFLNIDRQFRRTGKGKANHNRAASPESQFLGSPLPTIVETVISANPETYISEDDPPFLLQHGEEDAIIPVEQAIDFHSNLREVFGRNYIKLTTIKDAGHGGPLFNTPRNINRVFRFLDAIFQPPPPPTPP